MLVGQRRRFVVGDGVMMSDARCNDEQRNSDDRLFRRQPVFVGCGQQLLSPNVKRSIAF